MFAPEVQKKAPVGAFFHATNPRELRYGAFNRTYSHTPPYALKNVSKSALPTEPFPSTSK